MILSAPDRPAAAVNPICGKLSDPILINASRLEMTREGSNASSHTRWPSRDGKRKSLNAAWGILIETARARGRGQPRRRVRDVDDSPAHLDQRGSSRDDSRGVKCQLAHSLAVPRRQMRKLQAAWGTGIEAQGTSREVSRAPCLDGCRYANPSAGLQAGHSGPRGRWPATADSPVPPRARLAGSHPPR
jgi:hypothetical protein